MALIRFIGLIALLWCLFFLCAIVRLGFWIRVIRLRNSYISRVPGPRLAAWSRLWIARALMSGRSHEIWVEANAKFGSVARIGPNHVITDDPDIIRRILAVRSEYVRGPWFDSVRIDPYIPNIVSERSVEKHSKIRAKLAPSFTGRSVAAMEPIIDTLVLGWIEMLRKHQVFSCDIGQKIQFLTVDIITRLCLGDELGCVKHDCDMYHILETVETGNRLARIPALAKILFPRPHDSTGVGRLMGIVHEVVERRSKEGHRTGDVVSSLLNQGMSKSQIDSELIIALVAGSDTTSTAVQSTLLSIITNPQVYNTLRAEIRRAVSSGGQISNPIQDTEAKQLVYLQACVLEGLRMFPPLSQLRERVVPPGGDTLGDFYLPGGTFVGLNAWGVQRSKAVYGDNAELYSPERWLVDDPDRLHVMYQTHSLIFGHGSTKCLGVSMAMMEISKVIFELVRNFDITIANPHKPWVSQCYGIFFQKDFYVRLRAVDHTQPPAYEDSIKSEPK
ncbi:hypothetical protein UA08_04237 [Talaromyces atroroseus]|uniref:Pisatin demethylase n=1 Tax=Talaromyces atroroseus TaxID=1441469 RepID=A0A1Q5Q8E3_TALAT|nr:hypothetical protein UA08_04237 [Talaromyces atroroseus]OKL60381.1 hypothetical protein UA08_04237 [Talaromyces atroroseus]